MLTERIERLLLIWQRPAILCAIRKVLLPPIMGLIGLDLNETPLMFHDVSPFQRTENAEILANPSCLPLERQREKKNNFLLSLAFYEIGGIDFLDQPRPMDCGSPPKTSWMRIA